jgi:glyoxylase-like metal-dependent hydrolase (beta-lactamase superfamily II)
VFSVLPTPGHTPGSLSLLAEVDGQRLAFTGDLIAAPGKVRSLAAMQWTYSGAEGAAAAIASLFDLKDAGPSLLLPSHGAPVSDPGTAIDLLISRLAELLAYRRENQRLFDLHRQPYERLTPHLLLNRASLANSYVLLSESGQALLIDFGYDFMTGAASGTDRAARRPWLHSLPALKRDFGVNRIEVAIPTHYHDDHVAGFNLLRQVEGTHIWAPETFAGILENPSGCDLPCLWHDPVPVDRRLPLEAPFAWQEYELCLYPLHGHTRFAAALGFEVDGQRVLATGDQDIFDPGPRWNYVYQNRFEPGGYRLGAALYARLQPDLLLTGHWGPQTLSPACLAQLQEQGDALDRLHRELLPEENPGFGGEGLGARIHPYEVTAHCGERVELAVEVPNPSTTAAEVLLRPVVPPGWKVEEPEIRIWLGPCETAWVKFSVTPPVGRAVRRARLAVDLTIGSRRLGQQAEALITVRSDR